jgi:hypothetical protein
VARELAPARRRSRRDTEHAVYLQNRIQPIGTATQSSGSKLPRHGDLAGIWNPEVSEILQVSEIPIVAIDASAVLVALRSL